MVYKATSKNKEWIFTKKQKNAPLLQVPRVNPEMWDNASSVTTIKDTMLKKALDMLSASIIPVVKMADAVTKSLENKDHMPTKADM